MHNGVSMMLSKFLLDCKFLSCIYGIVLNTVTFFFSTSMLEQYLLREVSFSAFVSFCNQVIGSFLFAGQLLGVQLHLLLKKHDSLLVVKEQGALGYLCVEIAEVSLSFDGLYY